MKLIKWTLKLLAGLFSILFILFIVSLLLERSQLSYLKKSSASAGNESILTTSGGVFRFIIRQLSTKLSCYPVSFLISVLSS